MDEAEFRQAVDDQKRLHEDLDDEAVEEALEWYLSVRDGPFYRGQDPGAVLRLARRFQDFQDRGEGTEGPWPQFSVGTLMTSEYLADTIREDVVDLRRKLEEAAPGPVSLPFARYADAVEWLERTYEETAPRERTEEKKRIRELEAEIGERTAELGKLLRRRVTVKRERAALLYVRPGETIVQARPVAEGEPLLPLVREVSRLSEATRFAEAHLVAYVLADLPPLLLPAEISGGILGAYSLKSGGELRPQEVTITLRSGTLSLEELRSLYVAARRKLDAFNKTRLDDRDLAIWRAVRARGGPPETQGRPKAEKAYWESVAEEVGGYSDWRGPYQRWNRMQEKLPRTIRSSGGV